MATRRLVFLVAGALWLCLGILLVLTVFGTLAGLVLAYFVGIRRSATAARVGAAVGLLLLIPGLMFLDLAGCGDRHGCPPATYLAGLGLPLAVSLLNLVAGWPDRAPARTIPALAAPGQAPPPGLAAPSPDAECPGQQRLWDTGAADARLRSGASRPGASPAEARPAPDPRPGPGPLQAAGSTDD